MHINITNWTKILHKIPPRLTQYYTSYSLHLLINKLIEICNIILNNKNNFLCLNFSLAIARNLNQFVDEENLARFGVKFLKSLI